MIVRLCAWRERGEGGERPVRPRSPRWVAPAGCAQADAAPGAIRCRVNVPWPALGWFSRGSRSVCAGLGNGTRGRSARSISNAEAKALLCCTLVWPCFARIGPGCPW